MRMLSGRMHWLTVGLALLVSAHGLATKGLHGQSPLWPVGVPGGVVAQGHNPSAQMAYGMPGGMMPPGAMQGGIAPGGGMMMPDRPMSMSFAGPPPMDVAYAGGYESSGMGMGSGCNHCGGAMCGGRGCGLLGALGAGCANCGGAICGGRGCGILSGLRGGCGMCGGVGCGACGDNGCLFGGRLIGLLGRLAPYSEGGRMGQRWFDLYAGTIGLTRTTNFGGFSSTQRDPVTGEFARTYLVSTDQIAGTPVLRSSDLDMDKMRYGLELIGNLQLGPGTNLEARYFGLNNWDVSRTVQLLTPDLYSNYSLYGTQPPGGFDDTDRSFIHRISYNSELHSGEVNYRRRVVSPFSQLQSSWLAGVRHFDLDERFAFSAIGSQNNTFTFDQLRFFDQDTRTRNQLTGFQVGGDLWLNILPGVQAGVEGKGGIFGNHAEVETQIVSNSVPVAREHLQDGQTAYIGELTASVVYRLSYSWSVRTSYNLLYVDNVALAPENFNTRDLSNALGSGTGAFTINRFPFIETDGEVLYQGWSIGGEYLF